MAKSIRVPWMQWKRFRVHGVVREQGSLRPLEGIRVQAFDKDLWSDDFLGDCSTDAEGRFDIGFTDDEFKDAFESQPDIYLVLLSPEDGRPIHTTSHEIRHDASQDEYYEIVVGAGSS